MEFDWTFRRNLVANCVLDGGIVMAKTVLYFKTVYCSLNSLSTTVTAATMKCN